MLREMGKGPLPLPKWDALFEECEDAIQVIKACLQGDPGKRPTAEVSEVCIA